jgi:hypothetical protein
MHPLRQLRESGDNSPAAVAKLLAENVVFHSPLLVREVECREKMAVIMATSPKIRHGTYTSEYRLDDRNTFLRWHGEIEAHEIESLGGGDRQRSRTGRGIHNRFPPPSRHTSLSPRAVPVGQEHSWTGVLGIFGKRRVEPASTII